MEYQPGVYAGTYQTLLGKRLWAFLTSDENVVRMETATSLERPALEGVEEGLLSEFGADVLDDRVKQMIGHMTRQIMEQRGYVVAVQNVKMTSGAPFSRASRYKRRDEMTFHMFQHASEPRQFAITADKDGKRRPPGKWNYWKPVRGDLRLAIACGVSSPRKAREDIAKSGWYVYRMPRSLRAPVARG